MTGTVALPGDKSISHRAAMLSAIAVGTSRIENFAASVDCASTLSCLQDLGVTVSQDGPSVVVDGKGDTGLTAPRRELDCGNSGTTMRLLAGILAGHPFASTLTGDESLRGRPMMRIIDPLKQMGAEVSAEDGHAPINIHGLRPLRSIGHRPPVASAQIKSCVLLAGLNADGRTSVTETTPTRDHTERMLRWFGADVKETTGGGEKVISITGGTRLNARDIRIPGDISGAAFFAVAAASLPGSAIELRGVGLNPSRTAIIDVLRSMGASVEISAESEYGFEPVGDVTVRGGTLAPATSALVSGNVIPNIIDEIPILAVFGTQLEGGIEIRDASELRIKESDRIASIVGNLRRMNADVEEFPDGLRVGRSHLTGAVVDSFGDHRIAMAFAVAGLFADGETEVAGHECADVSFPGFFEVLQSVVS